MKIADRKKFILDRKKYILERQRTAGALLRMEKKYGWVGVIASIQQWMKKPYRGNYDYWTKP